MGLISATIIGCAKRQLDKPKRRGMANIIAILYTLSKMVGHVTVKTGCNKLLQTADCRLLFIGRAAPNRTLNRPNKQPEDQDSAIFIKSQCSLL